MRRFFLIFYNDILNIYFSQDSITSCFVAEIRNAMLGIAFLLSPAPLLAAAINARAGTVIGGPGSRGAESSNPCGAAARLAYAGASPRLPSGRPLSPKGGAFFMART